MVTVCAAAGARAAGTAAGSPLIRLYGGDRPQEFRPCLCAVTNFGKLTDTRPWPSWAAARTAIFEWIESWYNSQRLHRSLGYRTPADYEAALAGLTITPMVSVKAEQAQRLRRLRACPR